MIASAYQVRTGDTASIFSRSRISDMRIHLIVLKYRSLEGYRRQIDVLVENGRRIKMSMYFKNMGHNGGGYTSTIAGRMLHPFVRLLMKYRLGSQHLFKKERSALYTKPGYISGNKSSLFRSQLRVRLFLLRHLYFLSCLVEVSSLTPPALEDSGR